MFRELQRKNRRLPIDECAKLLKNEKRGVLSVTGEMQYPYGMPMNHYYNEEDGCVYFHCGRSGHRLDSLRKSDKVSFCVYDSGVRNEGEWVIDLALLSCSFAACSFKRACSARAACLRTASSPDLSTFKG